MLPDKVWPKVARVHIRIKRGCVQAWQRGVSPDKPQFDKRSIKIRMRPRAQLSAHWVGDVALGPGHWNVNSPPE